jgi:UDP-N-acetylglucosamine transferase subunit ALG13
MSEQSLGPHESAQQTNGPLPLILVTTGISGAAFDRLLHEIDSIEIEEELVVQHGPSAIRPRGATCVSFLPFPELDALVARARVVVTHGGVGSILIALTHRIRPIAVPRLSRFSEAVDDHQLSFARRLADADLVTLVEDPTQLRSVVRSSHSRLELDFRHSELIGELGSYLHTVLRQPPNSTDQAKAGPSEHEGIARALSGQ